jgi:hypothetical protein
MQNRLNSADRNLVALPWHPWRSVNNLDMEEIHLPMPVMANLSHPKVRVTCRSGVVGDSHSDQD